MSYELLRLVEEIKKDCSLNANICPISRLSVDSSNGITLGCGHQFRLKYLTRCYIDNCPYCGYRIDLDSLYKKCLKCERFTLYDNQLCTIHNKSTCHHLLRNGKSCRKILKKSSQTKYCHLHRLKN